MIIKKYLNFILFAVNILISFSLFGYLYYIYYHKEYAPSYETILNNHDNSDYEISSNEIYVEVKGAVKSPGVYKLDNTGIINDVILLAGGFKKDAYTNNINLSKHLSDEMLIYVYTKNEYSKLDLKNESKEIEVCQKEVINMCINEGESIIISGNDIGVVNSNDLVNINTATKEELIKLNGIGDAKSKAIIDYRNINGPFISISDLLKVSGISESLYEKIKAYITV